MNQDLYVGTVVRDSAEYNIYECGQHCIRVRTLSQMVYEISPLLLAQRTRTYKGIADQILNAGGLLTPPLYGKVDAQTTKEFYRDFFGDPL